MSQPNINFGGPIIFFDSHPDQQPSYLASYVYAFRDHLKIAWTGDVPKHLFPGTLRLVWYTTDGTQGLRDFELHQSELVKSLWDSLLDNPDVARAYVTGYSGQNPYVLSYGDNPWLTTEQKAKLKKRHNEELWARKSANRVETKPREQKWDGGEKRREQILQHIDEVILSNEESEKQRLLGVDKEDV